MKMNEFNNELERIIRQAPEQTDSYFEAGSVEKAIEAIKQAIEKHVIGEDKMHENMHMPFTTHDIREELRAEQRQKLNSK
jgi:hypothetical protein